MLTWCAYRGHMGKEEDPKKHEDGSKTGDRL